MNYYFVSMSNKATKNNIGVCIVNATNEQMALRKVENLDLRPIDANDIQIFELNQEQFKDQELELDRFYTRQQMLERDFKTNKEKK